MIKREKDDRERGYETDVVINREKDDSERGYGTDVVINRENDDREREVRRETVALLKAKESRNPPQ